MVDALSYFSFQAVFHDRCNKNRGMCYPVLGMMHIKEPLLLIGKDSQCSLNGFPLSPSGPLPYVKYVECVVNKNPFPSFFPSVSVNILYCTV